MFFRRLLGLASLPTLALYLLYTTPPRRVQALFVEGMISEDKLHETFNILLSSPPCAFIHGNVSEEAKVFNI